MAARATRSASRAARSSEDDSRCHLLTLSHDELGVIFDGLADPLQPVVAVALSSTCKGLWTPLRAALKVLKEQHASAVALCRKVKTSCARLCKAHELRWHSKNLCPDGGLLAPDEKSLTADDMATLSMIVRLNGLPLLQSLDIFDSLGDAGMQALCAGLNFRSVPSLRSLKLPCTKFKLAGAEALAAALQRGALPSLDTLNLGRNYFGKQGLARLTAPLRKLPTLKHLLLFDCGIDDEGFASLLTDLGKDDFKALEEVTLEFNQLADNSLTMLVSCIKRGAFPRLKHVGIYQHDLPVMSPVLLALRAALADRSR